jgi:hypothetical protein
MTDFFYDYQAGSIIDWLNENQIQVLLRPIFFDQIGAVFTGF